MFGTAGASGDAFAGIGVETEMHASTRGSCSVCACSDCIVGVMEGLDRGWKWRWTGARWWVLARVVTRSEVDVRNDVGVPAKKGQKRRWVFTVVYRISRLHISVCV